MCPATAVKKLPTAWTSEGDARVADSLGDNVAKVCLRHLPPKVREYIHSYGMKDFVFFTAVFKNGHEVTFRKNWKEFVAECILVHDLPPIERS